jgi:excisionase family DNA binding protein
VLVPANELRREKRNKPRRNAVSENNEHVSVEKAAGSLGVCMMTVYRRIKVGQIRATKIGRSYYIEASELASHADDKAGWTTAEAAKVTGLSMACTYGIVSAGRLRQTRSRTSPVKPQALREFFLELAARVLDATHAGDEGKGAEACSAPNAQAS